MQSIETFEHTPNGVKSLLNKLWNTRELYTRVYTRESQPASQLASIVQEHLNVQFEEQDAQFARSCLLRFSRFSRVYRLCVLDRVSRTISPDASDQQHYWISKSVAALFWYHHRCWSISDPSILVYFQFYLLFFDWLKLLVEAAAILLWWERAINTRSSTPVRFSSSILQFESPIRHRCVSVLTQFVHFPPVDSRHTARQKKNTISESSERDPRRSSSKPSSEPSSESPCTLVVLY